MVKVANSSNEFSQLLAMKPKIFLFGAGNIAFKTFEKYNFKPTFLLDNNPDLNDKKLYGIEIKSLKQVDIKSLFEGIIVICSTSIEEIYTQLISYGINSNQIILSPLLNQVYIINKFEKQEINFLLSSGLQNRHPNQIKGGGLYRVIGNFDNFQITKIIEGPAHGICKTKEKFYIVSEDFGVCELNQDLKLTRSAKLTKGLRPHGMSYSEQDDLFALACSHGDCVLLLDDNFNEIEKISLSDKFEKFQGSPQHHCNDICTKNGLAYVSAFSVTGNWKQGVFDGGIIVIDISKKKVIDRINLGCLMPHNISFYEQELLILDSLKGKVLGSGLKSLGEFSGFTRGFSPTNFGTFLIGQSKNRNFSRIQNISKNTSLDNSVIIFDPVLKISRTILMPSGISEIHSLHSFY